MDHLQFTYYPNPTDDAITHLNNMDTNVRILFIDISYTFNTIIPQHQTGRLRLLDLLILDLLTGRPQLFRIRSNISSATMLSTGAPQGRELSPVLFTLTKF